MKKKAIRFFPLMLAVILLVPLLSQPAFAAGEKVADYQGMPIFALGLANSQGKLSKVFLTVYLTGDPETGAKYLLGPVDLYELVRKNGYTMMIFGDDGYAQEAEILGKDDAHTYLYAPGLGKTPSLMLSDGTDKKQVAVVYREYAAEKGTSELIRVDCDLSSGWEKSGNTMVYKGQTLSSWAILGAPALNIEDSTVLGSIAMNNKGEIALIFTSRGKLPMEYSLEAASGSSAQKSQPSETEPAGTEPAETKPAETKPAETKPAETKPAGSQPSGSSSSQSKKNTNYIWIGVALAAAAAFWYYRKQNEAQKAQQAQKVQQEGTVAFDEPFPAGAGTVPAQRQTTDAFPADGSQLRPGSSAEYTPTIPVSQYQLRCVSGPLAGQTFPIHGELTIGRSSGCSIVLPNETPGVSSSHCAVSLESEGVAVWDLASTYGTFLGADRRLEPHKHYTLKPGDTFTLAASGPAFRLEGQGAAAQESGPAVRDMAGRVYRADETGRITFGRTGGNQIRVADESVSSSHCVLYRDGGQLYLKDFSSTNGTFFSQRERLKADTPYRIRKGMAFFLSNPNHTFVVIEE